MSLGMHRRESPKCNYYLHACIQCTAYSGLHAYDLYLVPRTAYNVSRTAYNECNEPRIVRNAYNESRTAYNVQRTANRVQRTRTAYNSPRIYWGNACNMNKGRMLRTFNTYKTYTYIRDRPSPTSTLDSESDASAMLR